MRPFPRTITIPPHPGLMVGAQPQTKERALEAVTVIVVIVGLVIAMVAGYMKGENANMKNGRFYCPKCGKQISMKLSRPSCRSCGYDLVAGR